MNRQTAAGTLLIVFW